MYKKLYKRKISRTAYFLGEKVEKSKNFGTKIQSQMADDEFQDAQEEVHGANQMISGIRFSIITLFRLFFYDLFDFFFQSFQKNFFSANFYSI